MNVVVRRKWFTASSTISEVWINGELFGYGLEPVRLADTSSVKPRAIPCGSYALVMAFSPRFKRTMPHVTQVPGFDGVLVHWGNYPKDTEACLLIGKDRGPQPDFIGNSRLAFAEFVDKMEPESTITYVDEFPTASQQFSA